MYQKFNLKNGLPVILVPVKGSQSVTVLVQYKVGSRYEDLKINHGASHFLEHLMFKGTKKRPTTLDISKELDGIGAEFNAYTAKDHTGYYIKANAEKTDLICDILADMLNNSKFDNKEIIREKGVIIEEIKMYEDQPMFYSEMLFENLIYKGNTLGEDIAGTLNSIQKMTRKDLLNYFNEFYQPQNAVIIIAGKINSNIKNNLNKKFVHGKKMPKKDFLSFENFIDKQKEPRILLHKKNTKQVHLSLGFPAYSYFHPDLYAFNLLSIILGGNMSSRLFINVRERKGLCYYIKAQADVYQDTGNLLIRAGLDLAKIEEAIKIIISELRKIKNNGVTSAELKMAKEFIKGRIILQLEETNHIADFYGHQHILTNKILTPQQKINKIFSVTLRQINKVAKDIIKTQKLNLVMISPLSDKKKIIKLLRI